MGISWCVCMPEWCVPLISGGSRRSGWDIPSQGSRNHWQGFFRHHLGSHDGETKSVSDREKEQKKHPTHKKANEQEMGDFGIGGGGEIYRRKRWPGRFACDILLRSIYYYYSITLINYPLPEFITKHKTLICLQLSHYFCFLTFRFLVFFFPLN